MMTSTTLMHDWLSRPCFKHHNQQSIPSPKLLNFRAFKLKFVTSRRSQNRQTIALLTNSQTFSWQPERSFSHSFSSQRCGARENESLPYLWPQCAWDIYDVWINKSWCMAKAWNNYPLLIIIPPLWCSSPVKIWKESYVTGGWDGEPGSVGCHFHGGLFDGEVDVRWIGVPSFNFVFCTAADLYRSDCTSICHKMFYCCTKSYWIHFTLNELLLIHKILKLIICKRRCQK